MSRSVALRLRDRVSALRRSSVKCSCSVNLTNARRYDFEMSIRASDAVEVMRAAGLEPLVPFTKANDPWQCRCMRCGREVSPTYTNVKGLGVRCKYCSGRAVHPDDAEAMMLAAGAAPLEAYRSKDAPWPCRCLTCGREITPSYGNIRRGQGPCIHCTGRITDVAEALGVMRAAAFEPLVPFPGANRGWTSRCERCDNTVAPSLASVRAGGGCRYCAGQVVDVDEAISIMNAAGFDSLAPYPGANKPWRSRCMTCGRETSPRLVGVRQGRGCQYCAGKAVVPTEAVELMRSRGFEPQAEYPGSSQPWMVRCTTCDRVFETTYSYVRTGSGCRFCTGKEVVPDEAVEFMLSAGYEPLEPYPGGNEPWRCRCTTCGRHVRPSYSNTRSGGRRCRFCTTGGIDYTAPGVIYLLRRDDYFVLKIGITTRATKSNRVERHEGYGWTVVAQWDVPTGDVAEQVERRVLHRWREVFGAPAAVTREQMPQGGWSETASLLWVDPDDTVRFVDRCVSELTADADELWQ